MIRAAFKTVLSEIETAKKAARRSGDSVTLVAVTKTFGVDAVRVALECGQRVFGENRVQEAKSKWPELKKEFPDIELHLIGPLQSNKVKEAIALFDVIESVDRDKIARLLAQESEKQAKQLKFFAQVNTAQEAQKAGISPKEARTFVRRCTHDYGLKIEGLMCIPPVEEPRAPHFALLHKIADDLGLTSLSMGMSADFSEAIKLGATHVRIGSRLFGRR